MADSNDMEVRVKVREWQDLHSREFKEEILGKVWSRITKIFGVTLLSVLVALWALYSHINTELKKNITESATYNATVALRTEMLARLSGDSERHLRAEAARIAQEEASNQITHQIRNERSVVYASLVQQVRGTVAKDNLVRNILITEAGNDVRDCQGASDSRGAQFRMLVAFEPGATAAYKALEHVVDGLPGEAPIGDSACSAAREHEVIVNALRALANAPTEASAPKPFDREREALARRLLGVIGSLPSAPVSDEGNRTAERLMEATAAWLRRHDPGAVADFLARNATRPGSSSRSHYPPAWKMLVLVSTAPALEELTALVRNGRPHEVGETLRQLATAPWPRLTAAAASRLLTSFEPHVPDHVLGRDLPASALEVRYAYVSAGNSRANLGLARSLLGNRVRAGQAGSNPIVNEWSTRIERLHRELDRQPSAAVDPPKLPFAQPDEENRWARLIGQLIRSVDPGEMEAFSETVIAESRDPEHRERRTAILALGLSAVHGNNEGPPLIDRLRTRVLELLLDPASGQLRGQQQVAFQRLLPEAPADVCRAALMEDAKRPSWVTASLIGCASRSGSMTGQDRDRAERADTIRLLARMVGRGSEQEAHALVGMAMLSTPAVASALASSDQATAGPGRGPRESDEERTARLAVRLVELPGANVTRLDDDAVGFLGAVRTRGLALQRALDAALPLSQQLVIFPAATTLGSASLPDWAYRHWWRQEGLIPFPRDRRDLSISLREGASERMEVICTADRIVWATSAPTTSMLIVEEGRPARTVAASRPDSVRIPGRAAMSAPAPAARYLRLAAPNCDQSIHVQLKGQDKDEVMVFSTPASVPLEAPAEGGPPPVLLPGRPVRVRLGENQVLTFSLNLEAGQRYVVLTSDLTEGMDTTLTLLAANDRVVAEDDDGGQERLASLIRIDEGMVSSRYLRVRGYEGAAGGFDLVLLRAPAPQH